MFTGYSVKDNEKIYNLETLHLEFDCAINDFDEDIFVLKNVDTLEYFELKSIKIFNALNSKTYINIYNVGPVPSGLYILQLKQGKRILNTKGRSQSVLSLQFYLETGISNDKLKTIEKKVEPISINQIEPVVDLPDEVQEQESIPVVYSGLSTLKSSRISIGNVDINDPVVTNPDTTIPEPDIDVDVNVDFDDSTDEEQPTPVLTSYIERTVTNVLYFKLDKPIIDFKKNLINLTAHGNRLVLKYKYNLELESGMLKLTIDKPLEDLLVSIVIGHKALTYNDTSSNDEIISLYGMYNIRMDYVSYFESYVSQYFDTPITQKITKLITLILLRAEAVTALHNLKPSDIIDLFLCVIQATNSPFIDKTMVVGYSSLKYLSSAAIGSLSASWNVSTAQIKLLELSGNTMRHDYRNCFSLINGHTYLDNENFIGTGFSTPYSEDIEQHSIMRHNSSAPNNEDKEHVPTNIWRIK